MVIFAIATRYIILICAGALVVLCLFALILSVVIIKKRQIKMVDNFKDEIETDRQLLLDGYLKRLSNIASNNDQYEDIYKMMSTQKAKLFNEDKTSLIERQVALKKRCSTEKYNKELKRQVLAFQSSITAYKKEIDKLQLSLEEIFAAGDKLRVRANQLKENYKSVKDDIEKYRASLETCIDSLSSFVGDIEIGFEMFDSSMESAKYAEAQSRLDDIEQRISRVLGNVESIAQCNNMVVTILPAQLNDLLEKNNELEKAGYVVTHAKVNEFIKNTNEVLQGCKKQFSNLYFANFQEIVDEIQTKMSEVHARLDQEVVARQNLDSKYVVVKDKIKKVESEFIKTKRQYSSVCEFYLLPEEIAFMFKNFEKNATLLSDLKREYDGYIFVNTKNPASFMLEKVEVMNSTADDVIDDMNYLTNYFIGIKNFVEETFKQVDDLSSSLIVSLGTVRLNKCKLVYDKYRSYVDTCLIELSNIKDLLMNKPIDITNVHNLFGPLVIKVNDTNNKMINDMTNYSLVERSLMFANPLRCQFNDVDKILKEVESDFINGDYKTAQDKVNYVLSNYHDEAFAHFKK